ncbi:MAG: hypothetical protein WBW31_09540 [Candidatus Sulfotelmatobacter sp.]
MKIIKKILAVLALFTAIASAQNPNSQKFTQNTTVNGTSAVAIIPASGATTISAFSGTVAVNGTAVTGSGFSTSWQPGTVMTIGSGAAAQQFLIASVTTSSALVLATNAGIQTSVTATVPAQYLPATSGAVGSVYTHLVSLSISSTNTAAATLTLSDGTNTVATFNYPAAATSFTFQPANPITQTAANLAWTLTASVNASGYSVTAVYDQP